MITVILIVVWLLSIVRVKLVYWQYSRALRATSAAVRRDIRAHRFSIWQARYDRLREHSFIRDVCHPCKWRYTQFFPDIPEVDHDDN